MITPAGERLSDVYDGLDRMLLNGRWLHGCSGQILEDVDPYSNEIPLRIPLASSKDLDEAFEAGQHGALDLGAARTRGVSLLMATTPRPATRARSPRIPATMRAAALDRFGGPGVLTLHLVPVPEIDANEVLVAVHTAGVEKALPCDGNGAISRVTSQGGPQ